MPPACADRATHREPRSTAAVLLLLAVLIAGCAPAPTPTPASSVSPTLEPSPTTSPAATPTATPSAPAASLVPPPVALPAFTTPPSPQAGAAWAGVSWRKLNGADSLATIGSIVRWRGGFVAVGAVVATGDTSRTPLWVSIDGADWRPLDPEVVGRAAIVIGVGETQTGIVALTLQGGTNQCDGNNTTVTCWMPAGPLLAWTSSDGLTWTSHPGPPDMAPPAVDCEGCGVDVPSLSAGRPGLLVVQRGATRKGIPRASLSRDGITWQALPTTAFPARFEFSDFAPFRSGFMAVGNSGGDQPRATALTSADGRNWVAHNLPVSASDRENATEAFEIVAGPDGVIVRGGVALAPGAEIWWTSTTGRTWLRFLGYPPLGAAKGSSSCEAGCAGYPNGTLAADGARILAYRGGRNAVAWTSSDGRSWQTFTISRVRPPGPGELQILPIGLLFRGEDGSVWFGRPLT